MYRLKNRFLPAGWLALAAGLCLAVLALGLQPAWASPAQQATDTAWPTLPAWLHTPSPTVGPSATPYPTPPEWLRTVAPTPGASPTPPAGLPGGFYLLDAAPAIQLYRKDYANGTPDFVQVIDLSQGARLVLMHGEITEPRPNKGVYGGADPRMTSLAIQTYWQQMRAAAPEAFCVTNGTFFYMPEYPTRLAFPLKVNGQIITDGWGIDTYIGEKQLLELWPERAAISEMNAENLNNSVAPDIVGGLTEEANKRAKRAVGRTFFGIDDRDGDGQYETLLTLNTSTAVQTGAAQVLRDFGADQVIMLDGGGSTQLLCRSGWHIRSDRPIPQAIAIYSAAPPPVAAKLLNQPGWQVLAPGEGYPIELKLQNTGIVSWTAATTRLALDLGTAGGFIELKPEGETLPGQTAVFRTTAPPPSQPGVIEQPVRWSIAYAGKTYPGESLQLQVVALPLALAGQREALQVELRTWMKDHPAETAARAQAWLDERLLPPPTPSQAPTPTAAPQAAPTPSYAWGLLLVPLLMCPGMVVLVVIVARRLRPA